MLFNISCYVGREVCEFYTVAFNKSSYNEVFNLNQKVIDLRHMSKLIKIKTHMAQILVFKSVVTY